tara:strand:+ start:4900 stop:5073 length:174 start_codon:yes stop_codon:yes gene_type:complete
MPSGKKQNLKIWCIHPDGEQLMDGGDTAELPGKFSSNPAANQSRTGPREIQIQMPVC